MCDQAFDEGQIGQVHEVCWGQFEVAIGGEDFEHGSAREQRVGVELVRKESRSTGVDGKGDVAEQILKGPAGSQMESDAAGGLADASA